MEKEEQDPPQYNKNKSVADMTPEERLRSLQAFAEEKKYIQPGGPELTPYNAISGGDGGFNSAGNLLLVLGFVFDVGRSSSAVHGKARRPSSK